MRKSAVVFLFLSILACSKKTPEFDIANYEQTLEFSEDFEMDVQPVRPMSPEKSQEWMDLLETSSNLVPSTGAIVNKVIYNNTLREIKSGSEEKNLQLKRLNPQGVALVSQANSLCRREAPSLSNEGEVIIGKKIKREVQMSWSGESCPLKISDSLVADIHFDKIQIERPSQHANILSRINSIRKFQRSVANPKVERAYLKTFDFYLNTRSYIEYVDEVYKKKSFISSQSDGNLVLESSFGDLIKGPLKIETIMSGTWKETRLLFLGESSHGQMRWVIKNLNNKYFEASVNGEMLDNVVIPYEIEQLLQQLY